MSNTAISIQSVSKSFKRFQHPGWRACDALGLRVSSKRYDVFTALRDVSLRIEKGECVALIGRNGAGKSTLLRLISNQMKPTHGTIQVNGQLQALMELGTGFHPDFTGIQNIYSALAYRGLRPSQVNNMIEDIANFTELDEFINRPVRELSSGMSARLAFAVATAITPDILIIDEILGAGDAYFLGKSIQRMKDLTRQGATVLFVSHDLSSTQLLCDRGVWLDHGEIQADSDILSVSKMYMTHVREDEEIRLQNQSIKLKSTPTKDTKMPLSEYERYGNGPVKIVNFEFQDEHQRSRHTLISGKIASASIAFNATQPVTEPIAVVAIYRPDGTCALQALSNREGVKFEHLCGEGKIVVTFDPLYLGPGDYIVSVALFKTLDLSSKYEPHAYDVHDRCYPLKILPPVGIGVDIGIVNQPASWEIL